MAKRKRNRGAELLDAAVTPKMTRQELADALGVTKQAIALWIAGSSVPRARTARKIKALVGVPVSAWAQ